MMKADMKISDCVKRGFLVFVLVLWPFVYSDGRDTLRVVFWNLENFFDYFDGGGGESDSGFSHSETEDGRAAGSMRNAMRLQRDCCGLPTDMVECLMPLGLRKLRTPLS